MDNREKLAELLEEARLKYHVCIKEFPDKYNTIEWHDYFADYLIANGMMVQEWIPVSELPKEEGEYWVAHKLVDEYFYNTAIYDGVCFRFKLAGSVIPNITHWSYLSPPPKGE